MGSDWLAVFRGVGHRLDSAEVAHGELRLVFSNGAEVFIGTNGGGELAIRSQDRREPAVVAAKGKYVFRGD